MIINKRSRFSVLLKGTGLALFLVSLALLSVQNIAAQPGDRRTPEQKRKDLDDKLAGIEKDMADYPDRHYLYEVRGQVLTELYSLTQDPIERESFAERAFADFAKREEFTREPPLIARSELRQAIWWGQVFELQRSELTFDAIETFLHSPHFEAAVSDYLDMIRRLAARSYSSQDRLIRELYEKLAQLYLFRAQMLARMPNAIKVMREPQLVWEDFDTAIDYGKKSVDGARVLLVRDFYDSKANAAYALGEYQLTLDAYEKSDEYLKENWERHCEYHGRTHCETSKKDHVVRRSLARGEAYLKTGDYEKAISNLNYHITKAPPSAIICSHFLMRAQAYRKLGNTELALADENKARQMPDAASCK